MQRLQQEASDAKQSGDDDRYFELKRELQLRQQPPQPPPEFDVVSVAVPEPAPEGHSPPPLLSGAPEARATQDTAAAMQWHSHHLLEPGLQGLTAVAV